MSEGRPETIYDLLRGLVDRTGWRTEQEAREYRELLNRLESMATFGDLAGTITTKTKEERGYVISEDVRQLRGDLLGDRPRLAARNDSAASDDRGRERDP